MFSQLKNPLSQLLSEILTTLCTIDLVQKDYNALTLIQAVNKVTTPRNVTRLTIQLIF